MDLVNCGVQRGRHGRETCGGYDHVVFVVCAGIGALLYVIMGDLCVVKTCR